MKSLFSVTPDMTLGELLRLPEFAPLRDQLLDSGLFLAGGAR